MNTPTRIYRFKNDKRRAYWRAPLNQLTADVANDIAAAFPGEGEVKIDAQMNESAFRHLEEDDSLLYGIAA